MIAMTPATSKKVAAIVVTYNRKKLLEECLDALLLLNYPSLEIYVIDNASTDGTKRVVSRYLKNKHIRYYNTGVNVGGSGGFFYGMKEAMKDSPDYFWLMDDDCIVTADALQSLLSFATKKKNQFGFLSSKVNWKDGSISVMNVQKRTLWKRLEDFDKPDTIALASFVSFFVRRQVVEDVGYPMKDFFIWGDDWEYSYRIAKKYPCYFVPDSLVVHKSATNSGVDITQADPDKLDRYRYAYRNEGYFYHNNGFRGRMYLFLKICLHTLRIFKSKCKKKFRRLRCILRYTREGLKFHPLVEYGYCPKTKIKVLECAGEPFDYGGQEAFINTMISEFSDPKISYTYFTPFGFTNERMKKITARRKEKVIHCNASFRHLSRKIQIKKQYKRFLKENQFHVVHIHSGSLYALLNIAKIARKTGSKTIILHSHVAQKNTLLYHFIKMRSDRTIARYANVYLACSESAAAAKFPPSVILKKHYTVIDNGLPCAKYRFVPEKRDPLRKELEFNGKKVLCHIGRFSPEKNHSFFLKIIPDIAQAVPEARFVFVGAGDEKPSFVKAINNLGLADKTIFFENVSNIPEILMASDLFLFPSILEGSPISLIEAEASGLPCLCSTIPLEPGVEAMCKQIPLDPQLWIDATLEALEDIPHDREKAADKIRALGYDAEISAKKLEEIYRNRPIDPTDYR